MDKMLEKLATDQGLIVAFAVVGVIMYVAYFISKRLTFGRIHGSAIAIIIGLALALAGILTDRKV